MRVGYVAVRPVIRLVTGIAIVAAIAGQLQALQSADALKPVNFFSFFTIDSNVLAALVLFGLEFDATTLPGRLARMLRGPATLYMTMTGIIYAVLLAPVEADVSLQLDWVNTVLHVIAPIIVLADWLLSPPDPAPSRSSALWWLVFPIVWVGYTIVRGIAVDWYPYPFIDPREGVQHASGSWGVVVLMIAVLTVFVALLTMAIVWLTGRLVRTVSDSEGREFGV